MFSRSHRYAAKSLRSYIAPSSRKDQLLRSSCRHSNFSTSTEIDSSTSFNDEENDEIPSRKRRRYGPRGIRGIRRIQKPDARKPIGIEALGKPGQIIVLSHGKRKQPKVIDKTEIGEGELNAKPQFDIAANSGNNGSKLVDKDYTALLEEFRSFHSPGDELSGEDWLALQTKLELSFTLGQLLTYFSRFQTSVSAKNETGSVKDSGTWVAEDYSESTSDAAKTSPNETTQFKDTDENKKVNNRKNKKLNNSKEVVAKRILRECWQLSVQDQTGRLDINLPSHVISLLVESDQYSLEELAHSHNAKIEPFSAANVIRVYGSRWACESVREIVNTYISNIQTEPIDVSLVNDLRTEDGGFSSDDIFRWITKTYGVSIENQGRKSTASASYFSGNENMFRNIVRELGLASQSKASVSVPFCSYAPSSVTGLLKPVSKKQAEVMSLLHRTKPWARWSIPIDPSEFSRNSLPPLFKQHYATYSSEILQVLRGHNAPPVGRDMQETLTATFGQCLFHKRDEPDMTPITAARLGELSIPRFWHRRVSKAKYFLPLLGPFPGSKRERLYRFRLTPCKPNTDNLPILEIELGLPWFDNDETRPSLSDVSIKKVKAIMKENRIDYLFPETNYDIRFTRTLTRDVLNLPEKRFNEPMYKAIMSSLEPIISRLDEPSPLSCQLPVPISLLQKSSSKGEHDALKPDDNGGDVKLGEYWFPSMPRFSQSRVRFYDFMGEKLSYSRVEAGPLGTTKDQQLSLEMDVAPERSSRPPAGRVVGNGNNGEPESMVGLEFDSFYRTACRLAFELSTHSKKDRL